MVSTAVYLSPLGAIRLAASSGALIGLWLPGQTAGAEALTGAVADATDPVLQAVGRWLKRYFSSDPDGFHPMATELPLAPRGSGFRQAVWQQLLQIPYGESVTYGAIADAIAREQGIPRMSAQAVGGAVGANPISIIIPCHRVLGAHGKLTGYGGGLDKKRWLLTHEGIAFREN